MNNYKATFSNGHTLTRSTARAYTHAYMVTVDGGTVIDSGFSSTEKGAKSAAGTLFNPKREFGGGGMRAYKNRNPVVEIVAVEVV